MGARVSRFMGTEPDQLLAKSIRQEIKYSQTTTNDDARNSALQRAKKFLKEYSTEHSLSRSDEYNKLEREVKREVERANKDLAQEGPTELAPPAAPMRF